MSSWAQVMVGTLNCICGVSTATSCAESVPNGLNVSARAGLVARSAGAWSPLAAAQAGAPTFFSTALRCSSMLCGTGASVVLGEAAGALGEGDPDGVALGAGAPPP